MATTAVDPVFVDTNILVYSTTTQSPFHAAALAKLHALTTAGYDLWTSRQILREYLASLSKPGVVTAPVPMAALIADVGTFAARFSIAEDGPSVTMHLLNLLGTIPCGGKQVHDANIVATMRAHGIPNLLTYNIADFQRFSGHITIIPLVP